MEPETFWDRLHRLFAQYDNRHNLAGRIGPGNLSRAEKDDWLECHARRYVIDHMLAGLGWNIQAHLELADHIQNLNIEHQVLSAESGHRRFLDYLGYERESERPLIIVEAKRPSLSLPSASDYCGHPTHHPAAEMIKQFCPQMKSGGHQPSTDAPQLPSQWQEHLRTLRDYFLSTSVQAGSVKRVVITNGEWLIIFQDPLQAFGDDSDDMGEIVVYQDHNAILERWQDIFERLAYKKLTDKPPWLQPNQVSGAVSDKNVAGAAHALRVCYNHSQTGYRETPNMYVTPLLLLVGKNGSCVVVQPDHPDPSQVPCDSNSVANHTKSVTQQANQLLGEVERQLGHKPQLLNIKDYYENKRLFEHWPAVKERRTQLGQHREFVVVTGDQTHFLVSGSCGSCPFHKFTNASANNCVHPHGPLNRSSTSPRCYFPSGDRFHCAHGKTYDAKKTLVTALNRNRTGMRSAGNDEAFCELWKIDQFLCCQSCLYRPVCEQSQLFNLPCPKTRKPRKQKSTQGSRAAKTTKK